MRGSLVATASLRFRRFPTSLGWFGSSGEERQSGPRFGGRGRIRDELTEAGRVVRSTVKYRPREGIFSKIARIVSVKVDLSLKDLFPK